MADTKRAKKEKSGDFDKVGLGALGLLVVGLAFVVWLALPKDSELNPQVDGGSSDAQTAGDETPSKPTGSLERLAEATAELAVLSDKPEVDVAKLAQVEAIEKLLD